MVLGAKRPVNRSLPLSSSIVLGAKDPLYKLSPFDIDVNEVNLLTLLVF